jgi:hypothetical protein
MFDPNSSTFKSDLLPVNAYWLPDRLWNIHDIVKLVEAYRYQQIPDMKDIARNRVEQSYGQIGDALGGKGGSSEIQNSSSSVDKCKHLCVK